MEKNLVEKKPENTEVITKEKLITYLTSLGSDLSKQEQSTFIEIASAFNLNPFKREIYCVAYGKGEFRKLSIITGYEVYIKRAERSGKLSGWKTWIEGEGKDTKAIIEIHRRDWNKPFTHEVYFVEVAQRKKNGDLTSFWKKSPRFQLKKVAMSQGFRLCFPDEVGGMPYTADELPDNMTERNVTPEPVNLNDVVDVQLDKNYEKAINKLKPLTTPEPANELKEMESELDKSFENAVNKIDSVIEPDDFVDDIPGETITDPKVILKTVLDLLQSEHKGNRMFTKLEMVTKKRALDGLLSKNDIASAVELMELIQEIHKTRTIRKK